MMGPKRLLVLYYSLTGQMDRVLDQVIPELEALSHKVDKRRITPVVEWTTPFDSFRFHYDWAKTWAGINLTQPLEEMSLDRDAYDYIVLGFQPWYLAPSIPVNSFLQSPMAGVFRGRKVVFLVTCRGRWERAYRLAQGYIEKQGGELADGLVIQDHAPEPANMVTTFYRLMEGRPPPPGHWVSRLGGFGIGEAALEVVKDYGHELATRFLEDRVVCQRGWRIVNGRLKMV